MEHNPDELIEARKKKLFAFLKSRYNWIVYFVLAIITYVSLWIRTRNLSGLKDVTTGQWTLGPDLDPFLFLRYAKHIVENGSLMAVDMMRYVPIGWETARDFRLHPYMMAFFHKIASIFGSGSVEYSAVIYPVFMFGITVIAFFLFVKKAFLKTQGIKKSNVIALVSSLFLGIMPVLLPRTIAGIPEKESAAFFFLFMAFYFFISSWESDSKRKGYIFAVLAGLFTGAMALIWGGYAFIFWIVGPSVLFAFILGSVNKERFYLYGIWIAASFLVMVPFSTKYNITNVVKILATASSLAVIFVIGFYLYAFKSKSFRQLRSERFDKFPPKIMSLAISLVILILLASLFFGVSFIPKQIKDTYNNLIKPAQSRLIQTVAENRQPYFNEIAGNFGPYIKGIPITFAMFLIGSVILFSYLVSKTFTKKERYILTGSYALFLFALFFSRYSANSTFNGENFTSVAFYILGVVVLAGTFGAYYYKYYRERKEDLLKEIDFGILLVFVFSFLASVSARGLIRLVMMLAVPVSIVAGYLVSISFFYAKESLQKNNEGKIYGIALAGVIIVAAFYSGYVMYETSKSTAQSYVPSSYNQQWQKAMAWVRENTPETAVFGHWWDYGYWVQSIGNRATVLDGGNAVSYWNHLMGRYGLTEPIFENTLGFLYAHGTTHFLIDSTDIGKYTAFSTIGSDESYDRQSWMPAFARDNSQSTSRKNSTIYVYPGGAVLDEDIVYNENGSELFLPAGKAGLGGVLVEVDNNQNVKSVTGAFFYQGNQYNIPLKYYFDGELKEFGQGIDAGVFFMPLLNVDGTGNGNVEDKGALIYLSRRTLHSNLAKIYLFDLQNNYFKLVHTESDLIINNLRSNGINIGEFVYYHGFRGPIKIWEINYPVGIELNEEYLSTVYPESLRRA